MFNIEIENRECLVVDGYNTIKELKCKLKRVEKENAQDELEECVTSIFGSIDCDLNGRFNNNSTDDVNDGETVEVMHDDYTYNIRESVDTNDINNSSDNGTTVSALSLGNIFDIGKDRMIETKIPQLENGNRIECCVL